MTVAPVIAKKLKQGDNARAIAMELDRRAHTYRNDVDLSRSHLNVNFPTRATDRAALPLDQAIDRRMGELHTKRKIRANQVRAVGFVISSNGALDDERAKEFLTLSVAWFAQRYGRENLLAASIHMDEGTPHAQLWVAPVIHDDATGYDRLCAKELFTPDRRERLPNGALGKVTARGTMSRLQDDFWREVSSRYGYEHPLPLSAREKGYRSLETYKSQAEMEQARDREGAALYKALEAERERDEMAAQAAASASKALTAAQAVKSAQEAEKAAKSAQTAAETARDAAKAEQERAAQELAATRADLATARDELAGVREETVAAKADLAEAKEATAKAQNQANEIGKTSAEKREELAKVTAEIGQKRADLEGVQSELGDARETIAMADRLQDGIKEWDQELDTLTEQISTARTEYQRLRSLVGPLQELFDALRDALDFVASEVRDLAPMRIVQRLREVAKNPIIGRAVKAEAEWVEKHANVNGEVKREKLARKYEQAQKKAAKSPELAQAAQRARDAAEMARAEMENKQEVERELTR